ncbi:hypothetical protein C8R42DRAFT_6577 [Lentinula raphanica]|nr:hypothetical protein C8R42DRAFT_6577 [Lentinula raphanica]
MTSYQGTFQSNPEVKKSRLPPDHIIRLHEIFDNENQAYEHTVIQNTLQQSRHKSSRYNGLWIFSHLWDDSLPEGFLKGGHILKNMRDELEAEGILGKTTRLAERFNADLKKSIPTDHAPADHETPSSTQCTPLPISHLSAQIVYNALGPNHDALGPNLMMADASRVSANDERGDQNNLLGGQFHNRDECMTITNNLSPAPEVAPDQSSPECVYLSTQEELWNTSSSSSGDHSLSVNKEEDQPNISPDLSSEMHTLCPVHDIFISGGIKFSNEDQLYQQAALIKGMKPCPLCNSHNQHQRLH